MVDHDRLLETHKKALLDTITSFEQRFSRFLLGSEVNQFREAISGTYDISDQLAVLLTQADKLRRLTENMYDPAIGGLLEHAGYNTTYRLTPDQEVSTFRLPVWSLEGTRLTLDGPAVFDLGGIGKGYCIDMAGSVLERLGYQYFLVEGGGDMYGTTKRDGSPYRIALEWPGRPDTAFGVAELHHQGVAVSDSFKRRWQDWHHIIDPHEKKPITTIIGATALAHSAFAADSMTSGLFLSLVKQYEILSQEFGAEFVVFKENSTIQKSPGWPGELF